MATGYEFFYKIDELHDLANLESVHALQSEESKDGEILVDDYILGMDELPYFKKLLKTASSEYLHCCTDRVGQWKTHFNLTCLERK